MYQTMEAISLMHLHTTDMNGMTVITNMFYMIYSMLLVYINGQKQTETDKNGKQRTEMDRTGQKQPSLTKFSQV